VFSPTPVEPKVVVNPVSPVTAENLAQRRRHLKRQRRLKVLRTLWRTLMVSGITVGVFWGFTRPIWLIQTPSQVQIQGNTMLSTQAILSLLPLDYPISLFHIRPQVLKETLETSAPIREASISRQLIPPQVVIHVQERRPVAQATAFNASPSSANTPGASGAAPTVQGLLDDRGFWIDQADLTQLGSGVPLPSLTVLGMRENYLALWPQLYAALQNSPVKVQEIDWRDPDNLILKTELGIIHCGAFSARFPEQLAVLDRMRDIENRPEVGQLAYIDLSRPDTPYLQMLKPKEKGSLP